MSDKILPGFTIYLHQQKNLYWGIRRNGPSLCVAVGVMDQLPQNMCYTVAADSGTEQRMVANRLHEGYVQIVRGT